MKTTQTLAATGLSLLIGAGMTLTPLASQASEEGTRNTTYGLGAAAAALLLTQKNKLPGALVGAGALYTGYRLQQDIKHRHDREKQLGYYRSTPQRKVASSPSHWRAHRQAVQANSFQHDNGQHKGWNKNGKGYRRDD